MPKYLFHLQHRDGVLVDEEGCDHAEQEAAMAAALVAARDIMAEEIRFGTVDLGQVILLTDESGRILHQVPFGLAISFQHSEDEGRAVRCPALAQWRGTGEAALTVVDLPARPQ